MAAVAAVPDIVWPCLVVLSHRRIRTGCGDELTKGDGRGERRDENRA